MKEITKVAQLVTSKEELINFLSKNIGLSFYDFSDKIIPNLTQAENVLYYENVDELSLREKPSTSGKLLATLGVCTYVKILNNTETDGYVYVKVGTMQGYVYKSYLVENLDDITVSDADVVTAKTKKIEIIETVVTNNGRKYMRDSKGNCYYMNGSKKVLVDRGYCD